MSHGKGTAFVALSGGVDSSVAALLLVREGWDVTGVFMKPWQPRGMRCLWEADRSDALRVAAFLDIPLETWDFSRQYGRLVSRPMLDAYRGGTTPNPDVECNRHIKFGIFADSAFSRGADIIATGHYARVGRSGGKPCLMAARDRDKDQTYFLWGIREQTLARTRFPVGHLLKSEVRAIARRAGLVTALKRDSQGICFVGPLDVKDFLTRSIPSRRGTIVHTDGRVLGTHDGAAYYTIGQRHGLDIRDGGGPYFVVSKDMRRNRVTVGDERALMTSAARIRDVHWIGGTRPSLTGLKAQIRYRSTPVASRLHGRTLQFSRPVRAVAPGQSVVFSAGNRILGGAILA